MQAYADAHNRQRWEKDRHGIACLSSKASDESSLSSLEKRTQQLIDLWSQGFQRLELLEAASELGDDKFARMLQCIQLTQSFTEQKNREQELQLAGVLSFCTTALPMSC